MSSAIPENRGRTVAPRSGSRDRDVVWAATAAPEASAEDNRRMRGDCRNRGLRCDRLSDDRLSDDRPRRRRSGNHWSRCWLSNWRGRCWSRRGGGFAVPSKAATLRDSTSSDHVACVRLSSDSKRLSARCSDNRVSAITIVKIKAPNRKKTTRVSHSIPSPFQPRTEARRPPRYFAAQSSVDLRRST